MLNRLERGTTAQNNAWVRPNGTMTIDTEKNAIRLHDGVTPGGYECLGTRAFDLGPGPDVLVGGTSEAGFYGEVTNEELVTYSVLKSQVGLAAGTLFSSAGEGWLKFIYRGKILYVAKTYAASYVSWNDMNAANIVYPGNVITIGEHTYHVRLLTGGDTDPATEVGGEWNALIYNVLVDGPDTAGWAQYTGDQLYIGKDAAGQTWGRYSICQETSATDSTRAISRGANSVQYAYMLPKTEAGSYATWRPVLELVTAA